MGASVVVEVFWGIAGVFLRGMTELLQLSALWSHNLEKASGPCCAIHEK